MGAGHRRAQHFLTGGIPLGQNRGKARYHGIPGALYALHVDFHRFGEPCFCGSDEQGTLFSHGYRTVGDAVFVQHVPVDPAEFPGRGGLNAEGGQKFLLVGLDEQGRGFHALPHQLAGGVQQKGHPGLLRDHAQLIIKGIREPGRHAARQHQQRGGGQNAVDGQQHLVHGGKVHRLAIFVEFRHAPAVLLKQLDVDAHLAGNRDQQGIQAILFEKVIGLAVGVAQADGFHRLIDLVQRQRHIDALAAKAAQGFLDAVAVLQRHMIYLNGPVDTGVYRYGGDIHSAFSPSRFYHTTTRGACPCRTAFLQEQWNSLGNML